MVVTILQPMVNRWMQPKSWLPLESQILVTHSSKHSLAVDLLAEVPLIMRRECERQWEESIPVCICSHNFIRFPFMLANNTITPDVFDVVLLSNDFWLVEFGFILSIEFDVTRPVRFSYSWMIIHLVIVDCFYEKRIKHNLDIWRICSDIFTGILVVLALLFLTPYFYFIPRATLAAIIIAAVVFMVEVKVVKPMWRTKSEYLFSILVW